MRRALAIAVPVVVAGCYSRPRAPPRLPMDVKALAVGWSHVCAVRADSPTDDDEIYCWGGGTYGQHGNGNQAHLSPAPVVIGR